MFYRIRSKVYLASSAENENSPMHHNKILRTQGDVISEKFSQITFIS